MERNGTERLVAKTAGKLHRTQGSAVFRERTEHSDSRRMTNRLQATGEDYRIVHLPDALTFED